MSNHHDHSEDYEGQHDSQKDLGPYWKRAHKDWRFWVGVVLMAAALFVYVMTLDLSLVPHR